MSKLIPVSIKFGSEYEYRGVEGFPVNLESELVERGYKLTDLAYAPHGEGGAVFVNGNLIGFGDGQDHPVFEAIEQAEKLTDDE